VTTHRNHLFFTLGNKIPYLASLAYYTDSIHKENNVAVLAHYTHFVQFKPIFTVYGLNTQKSYGLQL